MSERQPKDVANDTKQTTTYRRGDLRVKSNMVYNCVRTWYTHYAVVTTSKFYDLSVCLTRYRIPRF